VTLAPYPSLKVRYDIQGITGETFALVDTRFDGHFVVPDSLIGGLPQPSHLDRARMANGDIVVVAVFNGTVELVDEPWPIPALILALGNEYLIGIRTLIHFRVVVDHGQRVLVEP
jgi:predicted aspartyl protease